MSPETQFPPRVGVLALGLLVALFFSQPLIAKEGGVAVDCGSLANPYGPYDYTNSRHRKERLKVVEEHHFSDAVFNLRSGKTGPIGGDIDYTLRAFPNHHRALDAMARLALRERTSKPARSTYTIDCWFERAKRFAPKDGVVRQVHSLYHYRNGDLDKAIEEAQAGLQLNPNHAELHYNLGLFLADRKEYEEASNHARSAYSLGFPLPGLMRKLERAGEWDD